MPEKHLSTQFDSELTAVSAEVMELGGLVEAQILHAIMALSEFDIEIAQRVMRNETRVNEMEMEIDRDISSIIGRRQPTARDLRLLIAIAKTTANLERAGDEADKIPRMVVSIINDGAPRSLPSLELRVAADLASGLLHRPQVLVLDEPTVGLDIESRAAIWQVLRLLRDQGTTVLLSSHYLEEVDALADQLAIIEGGRVIAAGKPSELKAALGGDRVTLRVREFSDEPEALQVQQLLQRCPGVRQVVVNRAQGYSLNLVVEHDGVLEQLRRQLAEAQLPVFALAQSRPSLDDVYLQATGRTLMDAELAVAGSRDPKAERKQSMR